MDALISIRWSASANEPKGSDNALPRTLSWSQRKLHNPSSPYHATERVRLESRCDTCLLDYSNAIEPFSGKIINLHHNPWSYLHAGTSLSLCLHQFHWGSPHLALSQVFSWMNEWLTADYVRSGGESDDRREVPANESNGLSIISSRPRWAQTAAANICVHSSTASAPVCGGMVVTARWSTFIFPPPPVPPPSVTTA